MEVNVSLTRSNSRLLLASLLFFSTAITGMAGEQKTKEPTINLKSELKGNYSAREMQDRFSESYADVLCQVSASGGQMYCCDSKTLRCWWVYAA